MKAVRLKIYNYIKNYIKDNGYAPTQREIQEATGLKSLSSVNSHLHQLESGGYLVMSRGARGITLTRSPEAKYSFFAKVFRMKHINRWALMRNTTQENVSQHSMEAAMIAHALAVIGNVYYGQEYDAYKVSTKALFHDISEVITGDMPTPVKYATEDLKQAYKVIERSALERLLEDLPDELQSTYKRIVEPDKYKLLIKAADVISALIKCREEIHSGNMEFNAAYNTTLEKLNQLQCKEANKFIELFVGAFDKSLDEL